MGGSIFNCLCPCLSRSKEPLRPGAATTKNGIDIDENSPLIGKKRKTPNHHFFTWLNKSVPFDIELLKDNKSLLRGNTSFRPTPSMSNNSDTFLKVSSWSHATEKGFFGSIGIEIDNEHKRIEFTASVTILEQGNRQSYRDLLFYTEIPVKNADDETFTIKFIPKENLLSKTNSFCPGIEPTHIRFISTLSEVPF